jgi:dipeptidyl aminopeptidase/acylaminoacyl peptidase
VYAAASPLARLHEDAPPFLLIHGQQDAIIPVDEAREFHAELEAVSRNPVKYCEIPRAGHAFDLVDSALARRCAVEVSQFLSGVHAQHVERRSGVAV